jgi:hypothetical protein
MIDNILLIQTIRDTGDPDKIENGGAILCNTNKAWVGHGYYFWDTHIELGHWWGQVHYENKYMICTADGIIDDSCFDLHAKGKHRIIFKELVEEIIKRNISTKEKILVAHVIEFYKKLKSFEFNSIRILGINSIGVEHIDKLFARYKFEENSVNKKVYFDLYPPVQICIIKKNPYYCTNYKVIYPFEYLESYA